MSDNSAKAKTTAPLHEALYQALRKKLSIGAFAPGQALSLRSLAAQFGGSVTPIRDAVWRLAAEMALNISSTRRIFVPKLTDDKIRELLLVRALLEPEAAAMALNYVDAAMLDDMALADSNMNKALKEGDVAGYMAHNHAFHFTLYRASGSSVLVPMIEALWVRFGPFMRHVYPDVAGINGVEDHHAEALAALKDKDEAALRRAISADVKDALDFMLHDLNEH
ncbi:MAG: GntR family transcriptional regulator [Hyphomonadaceae bacterium]|nr:MAG: GntR family transcriptional regulator [Hyphomonadaceae bacterium]